MVDQPRAPDPVRAQITRGWHTMSETQLKAYLLRVIEDSNREELIKIVDAVLEALLTPEEIQNLPNEV